MKKSFEIIDNFLEKSLFENLKNIISFGNFPWFYNKQISTDEDIDKNIFYFTHLFYDNLNTNSDYFNILNPILEKLKPKALLRIKGNLYPSQSILTVHNKHVDYDFAHKGAIFYINTNDGFTIVEENKKIESIENRLLLFDASKPHSSTNCTNSQCRININFNYF